MVKLKIIAGIAGLLFWAQSAGADTQQKWFNNAQLTTVRVGYAIASSTSANVEILANDNNEYVIRLTGADSLDQAIKLAHEVRSCSGILIRFDTASTNNRKTVTNFWMTVR
ncbi:MAG: hypothetical protein HYW85_05805 [Deltaproteobacteria bacterium]|nr:hypothetical protein [Deltaproteobacteria bacterium]